MTKTFLSNSKTRVARQQVTAGLFRLMPSAKFFIRQRLICYHQAKAIPPISRTKTASRNKSAGGKI
ncbi:hypothetical protein [Treponema sp.]|uniref:hypothetical protein n=1 Tax=Treponema sp. TaxID=166 RepID=UPI003FD7BE42